MDAREKKVKEDVIRILRQLLAILTVWLLGWYGFSYSWIVGSFFLYIFWKRNEDFKKQKLKDLRALTKDEKGTLMQLKNLPSWVCFPDVERAEWLNQIVEQMWPFLSTMVSDILKEKVEPEIQKKLPSFLHPFKFVETNLGNRPIKLGGIKVYTEHVRPNEIIMDVEVIYAGDADVKVSLKGITAGISDVQLRGTMRIEISPLLSKLPLVGGINLYFLETPDFNFDLTNLLNVLDIPGLSDIVKQVLTEVLECFVVLPNRVSIPIGSKEDLEILKYRLPMGALEVKIIEATNLVAQDTNFFKKDTSDPYCICNVGTSKYETKVIKKTCNPKWKNETFLTFIDSIVGRQLKLSVYDSDKIKDDCLGRAEIDLINLTHSSSEDLWLPLKETKTGDLHVICGWYEFGTDPKQIIPEKNGIKACSCLFVKLEYAKDLPATNMQEDISSPYVEIVVGNDKVCSKTQRNTRNPVWEELFSFFINNPEHQKVTFKVYDQSSDEPLGTLEYNIFNLFALPEMKENRAFQLQDCFTNAELFMSVELKALIPPVEKPIH